MAVQVTAFLRGDPQGQATPLYHAIEMLRQLTTGAIQPSLAAHIVYLLLAGAAAFVVAMWRLERTLIK